MKCKSLEEVRINIDRIDNQIVKLIADRGSFVKQASKYKKNSNDVEAPQRVESVIQKVRLLANDYGADPNMVEKIYRDMIAGFINMEMVEFKKQKELSE